MKVLVTGGAGFIGSHLVDAVVAGGHDVRVLDSLDPQVHGGGADWPAYLPGDAERIQGDVRDPATVRRAVLRNRPQAVKNVRLRDRPQRDVRGCSAGRGRLRQQLPRPRGGHAQIRAAELW